MKIYEDSNPDFGKAFKKISEALRKYAPEYVQWVSREQSPDLTVLHVVGGQEYEKLTVADLSKTIIVQHCLYTTDLEPNLWKDFWKNAYAVISWNAIEDVMPEGANFFRIPLGADPNLFNVVPNINKNIKVFTTGHVAITEMIDSVHEACSRTGNVLYHTGENFRWPSTSYKFLSYMDERAFFNTLSRAQYVTGLRTLEGFEVMCIEGAMTGSVPIIPNLPSYDWYKDFGTYIDLSSNVVDQLTSIFNGEFVGLTKEQIDYVRHRFSWETVCKEFYGVLK